MTPSGGDGLGGVVSRRVWVRSVSYILYSHITQHTHIYTSIFNIHRYTHHHCAHIRVSLHTHIYTSIHTYMHSTYTGIHTYVLVLVLHFCAVTVSSTGPRKLFKEMTTATSGVLARFPWLLPIRNPCELRGPCRHSYFGPRTCGGGENQCHRSWQGSQSGFPLLTLKCPLLCSVSSTKVLNTVHSWCG